MRNLFVCHSQIQLILAIGLVKGRFINDKNDLILFQDFNMNEETKSILLKSFDKVLFRSGIYPVVNKSWKAKLKRYPDDFSAIKAFMNIPYSKIFEVCDGNIPEMYILKRAYKLNSHTDMIWLEDGSHPYYLNTDVKDGLNANKFTRNLRKFFFKFFFGLGKFYDFEFNEMGGNRYLKKAYITFKGNEREIFKSKEIVSISADEYKKGIHTLFNSTGIEIEDNSVVLVLDKLDVYKDLDSIKSLARKIGSSVKNKKVYYKYHPREERDLEGMENFTQLDKNLGIEYYFSAAVNKHITVLGIKSTGLQSAKVLGFNTISAINIVNEDDPSVVKFYKSIGVTLPLTIEELLLQF